MNFEAKSSSKEKLNMLLMISFVAPCTKKGEPYKNNSMMGFQNSLQSYFMGTAKINVFIRKKQHIYLFVNTHIVINFKGSKVRLPLLKYFKQQILYQVEVLQSYIYIIFDGVR